MRSAAIFYTFYAPANASESKQILLSKIPVRNSTKAAGWLSFFFSTLCHLELIQREWHRLSVEFEQRAVCEQFISIHFWMHYLFWNKCLIDLGRRKWHCCRGNHGNAPVLIAQEGVVETNAQCFLHSVLPKLIQLDRQMVISSASSAGCIGLPSGSSFTFRITTWSGRYAVIPTVNAALSNKKKFELFNCI